MRPSLLCATGAAPAEVASGVTHAPLLAAEYVAAADAVHRPATGHDSPTSILCLQCPSRVLSLRAATRRRCRWRTIAAPPVRALDSGRRRGFTSQPMGLNDHRQVLKQAELRVDQIKESL
jgi:hypothetical protein